MDASEIQFLLSNLSSFSDSEKIEILQLVEALDEKKRIEDARDHFLSFVLAMQDDYMVGAHHKKLAELLEALERGEKDRIAVSIAPRFGKSHLISYYYPAWYLGRHPDHYVIMASHTADLAVDFSRKVRNLINSPEYKRIFPEVSVASDAKAAGRWNTNHGGEFFAVGVGGAVAGRGAHLLLVDDPFSEQDVLNGNYEVFEKAYQWFTFGARTRLMSSGKVAIVHTRWAKADLIGRLVKDMALNELADQYEVVEFPAILPSGKSLWPEMWPVDKLERTKASMPAFQWNAQYQQNPTGEESAIVKREWWRLWTKDKPPECEYRLLSYDTAFSTNNRADYSACQLWGVFRDEGEKANAIMLNAWKAKLEFPELKKKVFEDYREWEPDGIIVEAKASGAPLIAELRRAGIPVQEYVPSKGNDKIARLNSVADMLASGMVWAPQTRWAEDVIEEVASFPAGEHDDQVDSLTQALLRIRQGGLIRLYSDHHEDDTPTWWRSSRRYYF